MTSGERSGTFLASLVEELRNLPAETESVEFKVNNVDPQELGEHISALANAAAINGRAYGYLVWGIEDASHDIVGTCFSPSTARKGNEPLETWLLQALSPKIHFRFHEVMVDEKRVVLLEVGRAYRHAVRFRGEGYIRVGPVKKPLKEAPDREAALWRALDQTPFEDLIAVEHLSSDEVLQLLDYPAYFHLLELPLPSDKEAILAFFDDDRLIVRCDAGGWSITNLGALLFARKLKDFRALERKAVRVIQYIGASRVEAQRETVGSKGYASGFEGMVSFVNGLLPASEVIDQALRRTVPIFPELAVRELLANALIHQDFLVTGAGPMVEIFEGRIEITNPGEPLMDTQRFVDTPPRSRNEALASLMRRFRICEERGSGIDKVVSEIELLQLPAPLFEVPSGSTRAVLFARRPLTRMDREERVRACYFHACLKWVTRGFLTNASLRQRFGVAEKNKAAVSRYIREALDAGAIRPFDEDAARKLMKYVPFWAGTPPAAN